MTARRRTSRGKPVTGPVRVDRLRVQNYRALRDLELADLTPLTVLLGPNGSGKSTVFDVLGFLSECFTDGVRRALERRGRLRELRTRGSTGPIVIELDYRERPADPPATYHLEIDEDATGAPSVTAEWLGWRGRGRGAHKILSFSRGSGWVISGQWPERDGRKQRIRQVETDTLAIDTLGRLRENPRLSALRRFVSSWHISELASAALRATHTTATGGSHEHLSASGDNLAHVLRFLNEQHPATAERIYGRLRSRVPRLEAVIAEELPTGEVRLLIKDAPFPEPIPAHFASDGTLHLLAYLILLNDPDPPRMIGIEEPEHRVHPSLQIGLAEDCLIATEHAQLFVTTHSPFFLDALKPEEVRALHRDSAGFTHASRVADIQGIREFIEHGAALGKLWSEGHFGTGDPPRRVGAAPPRARRR